MAKIIEELNRARLERDLTYRALGKRIGVSERTVYRILNFPGQRLHDRTAFKIQRFLDALPTEPKPAGKAKGRAA